MKKRVISVICACVFACALLAGCSSSSSSEANPASDASEVSESTETTQAAASVEEAGGFTEYPIFEGADLGLLSMNGVYFQAVPMTGGYEDISGYDIHIEADISANENTIGFGLGDWIPYLSVSYEITNSETGEEVTSGNFMPMSASDGPHYGQNIALNPDTYDLTISISPQEDTYLIHTDSETGPGGVWDDYFADGALTYTCEGWHFAGLEQ